MASNIPITSDALKKFCHSVVVKKKVDVVQWCDFWSRKARGKRGSKMVNDIIIEFFEYFSTMSTRTF